MSTMEKGHSETMYFVALDSQKPSSGAPVMGLRTGLGNCVPPFKKPQCEPLRAALPPPAVPQAGIGFFVHCEPGGVVPLLVRLARKATRVLWSSPNCTYCSSPTNAKGVPWKQASVRYCCSGSRGWRLHKR
jgi:hypothetical protein